MNGYLNNLTLRTLNKGHRIEPKLPSLFETGSAEYSGQLAAYDEVSAYEGEVTGTREAAPSRSKTEESRSGEKFSRGPSEMHPVSSRENLFEIVKDEDLQPIDAQRGQVFDVVEPPEANETSIAHGVEPANSPVVEEENFIEYSNPSPERGDLSPLRSSPRPAVPAKVLTTHRTEVKRSETRRALPLKASPETEEFQTLTTAGESVQLPADAMAPTEVDAHTEPAKTTERVPTPADVDTTWRPTSRRLDPTPAPWREARDKPVHWRRRPLVGPSEPEPSINVTIGRVEVRAVPADNRNTPSKRRTESPVMPLDEYLRKQRRGGEK